MVILYCWQRHSTMTRSEWQNKLYFNWTIFIHTASSLLCIYNLNFESTQFRLVHYIIISTIESSPYWYLHNILHHSHCSFSTYTWTRLIPLSLLYQFSHTTAKVSCDTIILLYSIFLSLVASYSNNYKYSLILQEVLFKTVVERSTFILWVCYGSMVMVGLGHTAWQIAVYTPISP